MLARGQDLVPLLQAGVHGQDPPRGRQDRGGQPDPVEGRGGGAGARGAELRPELAGADEVRPQGFEARQEAGLVRAGLGPALGRDDRHVAGGQGDRRSHLPERFVDPAGPAIVGARQQVDVADEAAMGEGAPLRRAPAAAPGRGVRVMPQAALEGRGGDPARRPGGRQDHEHAAIRMGRLSEAVENVRPELRGPGRLVDPVDQSFPHRPAPLMNCPISIRPISVQNRQRYPPNGGCRGPARDPAMAAGHGGAEAKVRRAVPDFRRQIRQAPGSTGLSPPDPAAAGRRPRLERPHPCPPPDGGCSPSAAA